MGTKTIKKVPMPENNEFVIDDKFISEQIELKNNEYNNNNVKIHFSDNFIFIEYEKLQEPFKQAIYQS
jgi:hypothetical protein